MMAVFISIVACILAISVIFRIIYNSCKQSNILTRFFSVSTSKSAIIKKHDSYASFLDNQDDFSMKITISDDSEDNATASSTAPIMLNQDLRQRSIHINPLTLESVSSTRMNIDKKLSPVGHSNADDGYDRSLSSRWQKLNGKSSTTNNWRNMGVSFDRHDNSTAMEKKASPGGTPVAISVLDPPTMMRGLKGTKPLVTINRLDILNTNPSKGTSVHLSPPSRGGQSSQTSNETFSAISSPRQSRLPSPTESESKSKHFHFNPLKLQDLKIDIVIGGGGFGQVWRGSWNGTPVAVKVLNTVCQHTVPQSVMSEFEEEVNMLSRLRHPNICMFLGACLDPPNRAIVTELVSKGALWDLLRRSDTFDKAFGFSVPSNGSSFDYEPFHWPVWAIRKVFEGTLRGLIYLHNQDIIHRDLKSANLLLDDSFNVKICDFGLAKLKDYSTVMTAHVGTIQWMSPEIINGTGYNESADIYSLGVVLWETLTGLCPFEGISQIEIGINVVNKGLRPPIPVACTAAQSSLLQSCWNADPKLRPTARQILSDIHQIFPCNHL